MHLNVLGFLGCYSKSKDTLEAWRDLKNIHKNEAPPIEVEEADPDEVEEEEQDYLGPASYTLSKEEKDIMFDCLNSMKVPSGHSSNIKGIINMKDKKLTNLKDHDYHMLMT
jgi:DNA gyrase inhibitor GyrI